MGHSCAILGRTIVPRNDEVKVVSLRTRLRETMGVKILLSELIQFLCRLRFVAKDSAQREPFPIELRVKFERFHKCVRLAGAF